MCMKIFPAALFIIAKNCLKVKVAQSCLILCDPMDYTVHGILQARILEWVAFSFFRGVFSIQGLNPGLLHCRRILYQLSHKRSPRILGWGQKDEIKCFRMECRLFNKLFKT